MKIEKLNENKIRITLNIDDLNEKDIDFHSFMSNSIESQEIFLEMLDKANKEVGFNTHNCKVMIEALAMSDGHFILTITRYKVEDEKENSSKKKINFKRKSPNLNPTKTIYSFYSFDEFCDFCNSLDKKILKSISKIAEAVELYVYNDVYYLIFTNIDMEFKYLKQFCSCITEFGDFVHNSDLFECRILEYGSVISPNNAISTFTKHFV